MGTHLNPASRRWYYQRAVTEEIDCGGLKHRISWRRGRLVLEDHDALAEQSLAALGAKPPLCVELLDMWRARRGSELLPELLLGDSTLSPEELALRKASHEAEMESALRMAQRMPAHFRNQPDRAEMVSLVERQAAERLEREMRMWAITLTEVLPPRLRRALALSVIVTVERRWDDDGFRRKNARHIESALTAIAAPVFELSARRWRRNLKPYRGLATKTGLLAPGEQPTCVVWADRRLVHVALSLPLSWFTDVWGRGIALVDDCFVMGVADSSADGMKLRVLAVRLEWRDWKTSKSLEAPALVTRGSGGNWQLHWV